jgi:hypothetical protein
MEIPSFLKDRSRWVRLYYIGGRIFFDITVLALALFDNPYSVPPSFPIFVASLHFLMTSLMWLSTRSSTYPSRWERFTDYAAGTVLLLFTSKVSAVLPFTIFIVTYSFLFWIEILTLLGLFFLILAFKCFIFADITVGVFISSFVYTLAVAFAASKFNLVAFLQEELERISRVERINEKTQREIALLERKLRYYSEGEEILKKLSGLRRTSEIPKVLGNMLSAEKVVIKRRGERLGVSPDEFIPIRVGDITVFVKPKLKFLLNDSGYRAKLSVVLRMVKPYLESFLAKSR